MILRFTYIIVLTSILFSCEKPEDRKCWKSYGDYTEIEIPLDSVNHFKLYKNIKYRLIEDSLYKLVLKGGDHMLNQITYTQNAYEMSIRNENSCNFLRDSEKIIEVEIHYPYFERLYIEPSDSVIFESTLKNDSLFIEIREGGGSMILDVNVTFISINVSHGTADYTLSGFADNSEIKIQNNGFANTLGFNSPYMFIYHNSTGDLKCNLDATNAKINIEGTGDLLYQGILLDSTLTLSGSGNMIKL